MKAATRKYVYSHPNKYTAFHVYP